MPKYKVGDSVTYAGNKEIFTIIDSYQTEVCNRTVTYYTLQDSKGHQHECWQAKILRLHKHSFIRI